MNLLLEVHWKLDIICLQYKYLVDYQAQIYAYYLAYRYDLYRERRHLVTCRSLISLPKWP